MRRVSDSIDALKDEYVYVKTNVSVLKLFYYFLWYAFFRLLDFTNNNILEVKAFSSGWRIWVANWCFTWANKFIIQIFRLFYKRA